MVVGWDLNNTFLNRAFWDWFFSFWLDHQIQPSRVMLKMGLCSRWSAFEEPNQFNICRFWLISGPFLIQRSFQWFKTLWGSNINISFGIIRKNEFVPFDYLEEKWNLKTLQKSVAIACIFSYLQLNGLSCQFLEKMYSIVSKEHKIACESAWRSNQQPSLIQHFRSGKGLQCFIDAVKWYWRWILARLDAFTFTLKRLLSSTF